MLLMKTFTSIINGDRLNLSINELAQIGQLPNGGVKRIAYSPEDILARQLIQKWMVEAGMTVRVDAAGNMIGTYSGKVKGAPALVTGSHIDTVPSGGRYDGTVGVLAGIEVARVLQENSIQLAHPFEVVVFTDEESSMIGCKAIAGTYNHDPEFYRRSDGTSIQKSLEAIGGNWEKLATAKRSKADIAAFVELHVEQGGVLETICNSHYRSPQPCRDNTNDHAPRRPSSSSTNHPRRQQLSHSNTRRSSSHSRQLKRLAKCRQYRTRTSRYKS